MDKQARIERISLMEDRFDKVTRVLGELDKTLPTSSAASSRRMAFTTCFTMPTRSSPTSRKCSPTNNPPGCHGLAQTMAIFAL